MSAASESWWVVDGRTLDLGAHAHRMARSLGMAPDLVLSELLRVQRQVPSVGEWFPRMDARTEPTGVRFHGVVRPAPPRSSRAVVITADSDPRTQPWVKGPDLDALMELRSRAVAAGADEAILLSNGLLVNSLPSNGLPSNGLVAEGALSAVVWWRGERLHHPPVDQVAHLPSTTAAWLSAAVRADGIEVKAEAARPDELAGAELWLLSALHGPRLVTDWIDGPALHQSDRIEEWRRRWVGDQRPVSEG